jgi:hypothetical protein
MKTILISGDTAAEKTELAKKIAQNYTNPKWCSVNKPILKAYYGKKLSNILFDDVDETVDLIIFDDTDIKTARHIVKLFERAKFMLVKKNDAPDLVVSMPDLIVIANEHSKRSI